MVFKQNNYKHNNVKAQFSLLFHRICKFFDIQLYYYNNYGVKVFNRMREASEPSVIETRCINPANIYFFPDGLANDFTLVGKVILNSPHFYLIKGIIEDNTILCRDYLDREAKGALDGRFAQKCSKQTLCSHKRCTMNNLKMIKSDKYEHPKVTFFNGCYYALDGKHRLAMASYLGKELRCDLLSLNDILSTQYIINIYKKMLLKPQKFSKNIKVLSLMMNSTTANNKCCK